MKTKNKYENHAFSNRQEYTSSCKAGQFIRLQRALLIVVVVVVVVDVDVVPGASLLSGGPKVPMTFWKVWSLR